MDGAKSTEIFLRSRDDLIESCAQEGVDVEFAVLAETKLPAPERRKRESATARELAAGMLAKRGVVGKEIGRHEAGYPIWPEGWVGSLSHSSGWCAAAQARATVIRGIGIDIENPARMKPGMWSHIVTAQECRALEGRRAEEAALRATAAFSGKETVFKILSPLGGVVPGFLDVEIAWLGAGSFSVGSLGINGRVAWFEGMVATVGWLVR